MIRVVLRLFWGLGDRWQVDGLEVQVVAPHFLFFGVGLCSCERLRGG